MLDVTVTFSYLVSTNRSNIINSKLTNNYLYIVHSMTTITQINRKC